MSLNKKLDLAFISVLLTFSLLLLLFNTAFLNNYYLLQKKSSIKTAYEAISEMAKENGLSITSEERELDDYYIQGLRIIFFNTDGTIYKAPDDRRENKTGIASLSDLGLSSDDILNLPSEGKFIPFIDVQPDPQTPEKQLKNTAMVGKITNDTDGIPLGYLCIYMPYSTAQSNTSIFNTFILYITVVILIISVFVVYFLSMQFTKPIKEAEEKTKKIANLDFSTKLEVKTNDEIGSLSMSINKMSDELEKNINDLKTANIALEKDLELKEQINTMREEFISDVSHELKTPISIVGGYSEALKLEGLSQEEINNYANIIMQESAKMNKLVRDLIKYTQIESGFLKLDTDDFAFLDVLNDVITPNKMKLDEEKVKLIVDVPDVIVNGDYDMLETVFQNFFSNALHYVDNERIIEVKGTINKDKIRITIRNTGNQISEENQKRIWDSFFKVDKARTRAYGGSGLGLSIVKSVMDVYQNAYGVYNNPDGVSFYFEMNLSKNQDNIPQIDTKEKN